MSLLRSGKATESIDTEQEGEMKAPATARTPSLRQATAYSRLQLQLFLAAEKVRRGRLPMVHAVPTLLAHV